MDIMAGIREWLNERMGGPLPEEIAKTVVAYYWDGAAPVAHRLRNLSASGANVVTAERWYIGTVLQLTLQHGEHVNVDKEASVSIRSRVIAHDSDGVRLQFLCIGPKEHQALGRFLHYLRSAVTNVTERRMNASSSGNSLVEFALILPLILLLVVNVVNFGAFIYAWITVANAARSASDYMVLGSSSINAPVSVDTTNIQNLIKQHDVLALLNPNNVTVTTCTDNFSGGTDVYRTTVVDTSTNDDCTTGVTHDPENGLFILATVDVTYAFTPPVSALSFPKLGIFLTLPPTTIHRKSVMRMLQ
jgi:Flp pilus assembly protein TadG